MGLVPNIRQSVLSRIWEELKHINYQQLNAKTSGSYTVCLLGTHADIEAMRAWLENLRYPALEAWIPAGTRLAPPDRRRMARHMHAIVVQDAGDIAALPVEHEAALRDCMFALTPERWRSLLHGRTMRAYVWHEDAGEDLVADILEDLPQQRFALSYVFPVFRPQHARMEIRATALQNASWAVFSAAPNLIPNPGQLISVPTEAVSDFLVMTVNEIKMMFELVALCGRKVQPLQCMPEFGIVLGLAKAAEMTATNLTGKAPGVGLAIKGGVAFAFTSAIGEALFLYEIAGVQLGGEFIRERARVWLEEGKAVTAKLLKRGAKEKET